MSTSTARWVPLMLLSLNLLSSFAIAHRDLGESVKEGETPTDKPTHHCIHDEERIQNIAKRGIANVVPQEYHVKDEAHRAELKRRGLTKLATRQSIRITLSTADLDDSTKFCTSVGQTVSDMAGSTVTCTQEDIFTSTMKSTLITNLGIAVNQISTYINVDRVATNLIVTAGSCSPYTIPSSYTTQGVPNTDLVIFVSAAPVSGSGSDSVLAFAASCGSDGSGRSIYGVINFAPKYITTPEDPGMINTALHEITHTLGFSASRFKTTTAQLRGKTVTLLNTPEVVTQARNYIGCNSLVGGELEDEGGSGSAGSHWERRIFKDEIMTATSGTIYSVMTLAALKDFGVYDVNYANAETMHFGANAGCGFTTQLCNTQAGGDGTFFCFTAASVACTDQNTAIGLCGIVEYSSALPGYFQYFSDPNEGGRQFTDYCPVYEAFSNRDCIDTTYTPTSTDMDLGYYFGTDSRCFLTSGLIVSSKTSSSNQDFRCLKTQCPTSNQIQFQVGSSGWINCPTDGSAGVVSAPAGYTGTITCPAAAGFCATATVISIQPTPPPGPPTPLPTPVPPTAIPSGVTGAPLTGNSDVSVSGTIVLTGTQYPTILASTSGTNALSNAVRADIAGLCSLDTSSVRVDSMKAGSLIVGYSILGLTGDQAAAAQTNILNTPGESGFLIQTNGVYGSTGDKTIVAVSSATATAETSNMCGTTLTDQDCRILIGILVGIGGSMVISIIITCVCCRRRAKQDKRRAANAASEPYEHGDGASSGAATHGQQGGQQGSHKPPEQGGGVAIGVPVNRV